MPHEGETHSEVDALHRLEYDVLGDPIDSQALTVSTTVLALTVPGFAKGALVECQAEPVRWRVDGDSPTATVGHRLIAGERIQLGGIATIRGFRVLREGATDASLFVTYFD